MCMKTCVSPHRKGINWINIFIIFLIPRSDVHQLVDYPLPCIFGFWNRERKRKHGRYFVLFSAKLSSELLHINMAEQVSQNFDQIFQSYPGEDENESVLYRYFFQVFIFFTLTFYLNGCFPRASKCVKTNSRGWNACQRVLFDFLFRSFNQLLIDCGIRDVA